MGGMSARWMVRLMSGENDWQHAITQKTVSVILVAWNASCHTTRQPAVFKTIHFWGNNITWCSNFMLKWTSSEFYNVVRWHFSGVVDKFITTRACVGNLTPVVMNYLSTTVTMGTKTIKIGSFLTELLENNKGNVLEALRVYIYAKKHCLKRGTRSKITLLQP